MSRIRLFIIMFGVVLVGAIILIAAGVLPGLKSTSSQQPVTLNFWGTGDQSTVFRDIFAAYKKNRPNVTIRYREIPIENYETELVNGLAAGKGPDVLMFHNTWLPKHYDKIVPLSDAQLTLGNFQNLFPRVAEQDFAPDGVVYALPLYIDTMALIYNKDIFDRKAIALPPTTWEETLTDISKIREIDKAGNIQLAGAAIGGSARSVNRASDILSLLMLQSGVQMTTKDFSRATFSENGLTALNFYTKFANPTYERYTWNDNSASSLDAFAGENVGIVFDYAHNLKTIQEKNPFLHIGVSLMPQPADSTQRVDYANYFGLAVAASSRIPNYAMDFMLFLTTDPLASNTYLQATGHPPALRSLIQNAVNDPAIPVFARQALTARSWTQGDSNITARAFSDMIQSVIAGKLTPTKAIKQAEDAVTATMHGRS